MKADLHLHTSASDGTDTPSKLLRKLEKLKFTHAAVTDHDTCEGCAEAVSAGARCDVKVIPGIELSADAGVEVHVLGYGLAPETEGVKQMTAVLKAQREARMRLMIKKLNDIGVDISADEVFIIAKGVAGRAHIARILVKKKYASSVKGAFAEYLSPGRVAYIPREKLSAIEAVDWLDRHGGVAVLAHPGLIEMNEGELFTFIKRLKDRGLRGVEAYHPGHTNKQCLTYDNLGRGLNLCITGGSDYHGENKENEPGFRLERWKKMEADFIDLYHKIPIRGLE